MKKTILIYGVIAGVIVAALMLISMNYFSYCEGNVDYDTSMLIGYASMLIAFSLIFTGIRNYRDKYNGGVINFGNAFKTGFLIALIASTFYVVTWLIYSHFFAPDFMEKYAAHSIEQLKASGAGQAELDKQAKEMEGMVKMLKNPFFHVLMTYMEILPVGIIVTLISSLILKKKTANS
ncbi:DUF4199 family protein [Flavobacterium sp. Sd200]|uniref:DUF4199 domain-containing protein n=1 Tax=Flavobacterium sp. Sd200 TaxID=2692211 RepID=UPI00136E2204|nr:DUF4199 domain-containing protein [Flavobacterium sp. Sd200]MXN93255.1 DUF4199 family protein [Flavobacterium sp. Sd200]